MQKKLIKIYTEKNSIFPHLLTIEHFDEKYEFTIVKDGTITYSIEGQHYSIFKNQMIFINSNVPHHRVPADDKGEFETILISPEVIFPGTLKNYYEKVSGDNAISFMLFSKSSNHHREIVDLIENTFNIYSKKEAGFELEGLGEIYKASNKLVNYIEKISKRTEIHSDMDKIQKIKLYMKIMLGYIQNNYQKKITLAMIGKSAEMCRSRCCSIFKSYLNESVNDYLARYRLAKSIELYCEEDFSIVDAAKMSGFNGASYYSELFKKVVGCTPTEYKEKIMK